MTEAVTPPNPADGSQASYKGQPVTEQTPDPTLLTIDSIRREIAMLENLMATQLQNAGSLTEEKFRRVDDLMERAEEMRREQKSDTASAVDAALASQEAATQKMEKSITDQINSLRSNFETSIGGVQSNIGDLKERMTTLESIKQGQSEERTETRAITAGQIAAIGIGITILLAILTIIAFMAGSNPPLPPSEVSIYSHFYT